MNLFNYKYFKWIFLPVSILEAGFITKFSNTTLVIIYGVFLFLLPYMMYEGQRNSMRIAYGMDNRFKLDNRKFFLIWLFSHGFIILAIFVVKKMFGRGG